MMQRLPSGVELHFLQQAEGCQMANAGVPAYLCLDPYR